MLLGARRFYDPRRLRPFDFQARARAEVYTVCRQHGMVLGEGESEGEGEGHLVGVTRFC